MKYCTIAYAQIASWLTREMASAMRSVNNRRNESNDWYFYGDWRGKEQKEKFFGNHHETLFARNVTEKRKGKKKKLILTFAIGMQGL